MIWCVWRAGIHKILRLPFILQWDEQGFYLQDFAVQNAIYIILVHLTGVWTVAIRQHLLFWNFNQNFRDHIQYVMCTVQMLETETKTKQKHLCAVFSLWFSSTKIPCLIFGEKTFCVLIHCTPPGYRNRFLLSSDVSDKFASDSDTPAVPNAWELDLSPGDIAPPIKTSESKQHHVTSDSRFDVQSPKALCPCFRKQRSHARHLFALQPTSTWTICRPQCLRKRFCTRALTGYAHMSVRGQREVDNVPPHSDSAVTI